jgi:phage gp29-like protein
MADARIKKKGPQVDEVAKAGSPSQLSSYRYSILDSDIDNILAREGLSLYTRRMITDDQVKACIMIKRLGVTVGGWTVQPAVGESEEGYEQAKEIADFVKYCLLKMGGSVEELLMAISWAVVPGFSVNEILWQYFETGPYSGKLGIGKIKPRPADTFTFDMDEFGNVNTLIQTVQGDKKDVPLEKVLLYTYDPYSTGLPMGVSDLRAAYKHWRRKDAMMRFSCVAGEKFASPNIVGTFPRGASDSERTALLNACMSLAIETAAIIPEACDIKYLESKGSVIMPYDQSIAVSDRAIARAIFAQVLATNEGTDGAGSYAQAKIHAGILGMFLTGLRQQIAQHVLMDQLVKRLVDYNYPDTDLYPTITLAPPDDSTLGELSEVIERLVNVGVVDKNEPFVRAMVGFPPKPLELIERDRVIDEAKATWMQSGGLNGVTPGSPSQEGTPVQSQPNVPNKQDVNKDGPTNSPK